MEAVPGYLSLHQSAESLTLKWTPNQLMNGTLGDSELEKRWGLWDSLPGAREGSKSLPPGRGVERPSLLQEAGLTLYPMPRIAERGCLEIFPSSLRPSQAWALRGFPEPSSRHLRLPGSVP